jgi:2-polyprenyl-3-methyl-5-hydroxy-6-metoxy-1,4-benzoquinol methylase
MNSTQIVRNYFEREARRFDAIYEDRKPLVQRIVDKLFRAVVVRRFQLICNLSPCAHPWSLLDVGCGSARYSVELSRAGATRVVGIDIANEMIALAQADAQRANVADRCEFVTGRFLDYKSSEKFDIAIATGYFDYLVDPLDDLRKMIEMCSGRIFASFPKRWELRTPIRKLRFAIAQGFVRFYSRREIVDLFRRTGLPEERLSLIDLGRDWIAVARMS